MKLMGNGWIKTKTIAQDPSGMMNSTDYLSNETPWSAAQQLAFSDFLLMDLRSTTSFSPDFIIFESHKKTPNVVYSTRRLVSVVKREVNCNQGIAQEGKL